MCNIQMFAQKNYPCEIELSPKAEKLYKQGKKAQDKGENDKATTLFKAATEEQDDWVPPYYSLAMQTIRKIERGEEKSIPMMQTAIYYFEKVVNNCPEYNHEAYLHLGKLYYSIENYSQAVKYLEIFIEDPDKIKKTTQYDEAEWFLSYSKVYEKLYGNPVPYAPRPVAGLSTSNDEYLARLSPDEEYMLYSRRTIEQSNNKTLYSSNKVKETFTISQRIEGDSFTVGTPMPSPPFNITGNEGSPTITLDNKYLVFTRCANIPIGERQETYYNCDLYYSEYINGEWTTAKNMGNLINRKDSWESQASISPDGQVLFFASDRPGGTGENYNTDIYFSLRDANGNWQKAQNLGPIINTPGNERSPFIHSDGKTLYFSSNGHIGIGGYDVFLSRQSDAGTWQKPINIGYPINSEKDEVGMFINTLGDKAYFSTNAITGNYDICQFDLYSEARPQSVMLIKGKINNISKETEETKPVIELKNLNNKTSQQIHINEDNGKYAVIIKDTTTDHLLTVKQKGYVYEAKYISAKMIIDSSQSINNVDFSMHSIEKGESYKINDINFATNSYELTQASSLVLEVLIEFLQDNPTINIEIQGHTDNIGKREDNMILSENRAKAVYEYLINNDINPNRLSYKGFADTRPIATNTTEKGRAMNRRTVFVILNE